jgi:DNA-binding winged helix-turn-helix (wHTH) protein
MRVRFGACTFDSTSRELRRDGELRPLSPKAFRLLELLLEARPDPVSKETLDGELWPDVVVEPGNLYVLVAEIRKALGSRGAIRTIPKLGYAFAATVADEESVRFSVIVHDAEVTLVEGENVIGRDRKSRIWLPEPAVSRNHAQLIVAGNRVTLADSGSKNGTWYDGRRVAPAVALKPGDEFIIGETTLRLVRVDPQARTATAG